MRVKRWTERVALAALAMAWPLLAGAVPSGEDARETAVAILRATGVTGGIIVHLGCGDGKLTAALRANDSFTVHGLEPDPAQVAAARAYIAGLGLYGPVSVERLAGARLPHSDNLVNLVVSENRGLVPMDEVLRVLAPNGVAYIKAGGKWEKTVKPRPGDIDDWTHFLHDAGNNAVARDTRVGPPRSIQWVAPPLWLRSHETPSGIEGLVSGGGRLFYFFDEGLIGITDQRLPERWALICRDAFNGALLWRKPIEKWGWPEWARDKFEGKDWTTITGGRTVVPIENQRRIVADGDRLYVTLGFNAPLSILDAATGKIRATVPATAPAREILASDGVALVYRGSLGSQVKKRTGDPDKGQPELIAVKGETASVLWKKSVGPIRSLLFAIDHGRVICLSGAELVCMDLKNGRELWRAKPGEKNQLTLVANSGVALILGGKTIEARGAADGRLLWRKEVPSGRGAESPDLFVADGLVWRGMVTVQRGQQLKGRSPDAMAVAYDLRTGEERKRVVVPNLRSPDHHHRCYRNKATERYIISGMEGVEFMDLQGDNSGQNNWVRGACKLGIMPCNGLLYAPADQCFCQPGGKLLGFAALGAEAKDKGELVADDRRLEKGEAYGTVDESTPEAGVDDWPTYRHDAARHGATPSAVAPNAAPAWRVKLGGGLTAPVAMGDRVCVASCDAHTVRALDAKTGKTVWSYVAGGRVDSPPTLYKGVVLFGSADGSVYCLRASDGALAWRFLAAPVDRRVGCFDQIESAWPVHGSVLVRDGVAYFAAGRSTYLDGGIRIYGVNPFTGKLFYKTTLEGPFPDVKTKRDVSFWVPGANSDVLVSEGDSIYMRQKKLTPTLEEVKPPVLSSKGESDVGLHVFSTSGLLDGSWYNRTFWMYSKRWPGFQLANQAPKSGQILVVDVENTYAVKVFYRRNVHTTMFFPGKEGYLLFADKNANEPQIVGEEGARKPVAWLPQSEFMLGRKNSLRSLDSSAFGLDKMIGYTRAEPPLWTQWLPIRMRAMVKAGPTLFVAGPPDTLDPKDPYAAFEGRKGARLAAISAKDGTKLSERELESPPVFDGLIAAGGRLFVSLEDGSLACFAGGSR